MLYRADAALGSLASVVLSWTPAPTEYNKMLLPQSGKAKFGSISTGGCDHFKWPA